MKASQLPPADVDAYIATFPTDVQAILQKIRSVVKKAAPAAEETISYRMPTYKLHGNLVHFAAFKEHIGFYPTPDGFVPFEDELKPYVRGKGSVQFPLDRPIPYPLIRRIVEHRVAQSEARAAERKRKK